METGKNLRRLRRLAGLTQDELGRMAGTSCIAMIESGRRPGRIDTLSKIARALGCTVSDLVAEPKRRRA